VILDTSVLYDLVVDGPRNVPTAQFIAQYDLASAPDLIEIEIASALTRSVRRKHLSPAEARTSYELALQLMPDIEPSKPLMNRAFELSLQLVHPTPDCVFLALAERQSDLMVTSDARLWRKLAGTPYAGLVKLIEP
jgi:predicted nucleic acid-binding protein